jgi:hypothetical protein
VDLHTRRQTIAMLNVETGVTVEKTLRHEGESVLISGLFDTRGTNFDSGLDLAPKSKAHPEQ